MCYAIGGILEHITQGLLLLNYVAFVQALGLQTYIMAIKWGCSWCPGVPWKYK